MPGHDLAKWQQDREDAAADNAVDTWEPDAEHYRIQADALEAHLASATNSCIELRKKSEAADAAVMDLWEENKRLRADKDRLDWLESDRSLDIYILGEVATVDMDWTDFKSKYTAHGVRAAIDAAMQAGKP